MGADASGGLGRGPRAHPAAVLRRDRPHGPPGDRQRERRGTRPVLRAGAAGSPPPRGPAAGPGPVRRSRPGRLPPVRGRAAGAGAGPTVPLYSAASRGVGRPFDKAAAAVHRRPLQPPPRPPEGRGRGRSGIPSPAAMPPGGLAVGALRPPDGGGSDERWRAQDARPGGPQGRSSPPPREDGGPTRVSWGGRRGGRGVVPPEAGMRRACAFSSPAEHGPQGRGAGS